MVKLEDYETYVFGLFRDCYADTCQKIESYDEKKMNEIRTSFLNVMSRLFERIIQMQESGTKGDIHWIAFFYLRSSVINNTDAIQIQLFDEEVFLDKQEVYVLVRPSFVMDCYRADLNYVKNMARQNVAGIREPMMNQLDMHFSPFYFQLILHCWQKWIDDLIQLPSYQLMKKDRNIMITHGEYMEEHFVLYLEDGK